MSFRTLQPGSIVLITANGSRSTDGEPRQIPAIVIDQYAEDGVLVVFAFHFEGQYLARVPVADVTVLFDPATMPTVDQLEYAIKLQDMHELHDLTEFRRTVVDDIQTLQRQLVEFKEEVMGMLTAPPALPTPGDMLVPMDSIEYTAPPGVDSTRRSRK